MWTDDEQLAGGAGAERALLAAASACDGDVAPMLALLGAGRAPDTEAAAPDAAARVVLPTVVVRVQPAEMAGSDAASDCIWSD